MFVVALTYKKEVNTDEFRIYTHKKNRMAGNYIDTPKHIHPSKTINVRGKSLKRNNLKTDINLTVQK